MHFYITLMGMRTVFTLNVGPFTIYYLGYPQTDEHRADIPKFGLDTAMNLQSTLGLLELYHVHGSEKQADGYYQTGNSPPNLGFGHLGFTVPDVKGALDRLKAEGVEVVKDLGVVSLRSIPISEWENENGVGTEDLGTDTEIHHEYKKVFGKIAFVRDPVSYFSCCVSWSVCLWASFLVLFCLLSAKFHCGFHVLYLLLLGISILCAAHGCRLFKLYSVTRLTSKQDGYIVELVPQNVDPLDP